MLVGTPLFMGGKLGIQTQSILWCEVPNEMESWILFIIRVLCCIKLSLSEVNGLHLCMGWRYFTHCLSLRWDWTLHISLNGQKVMSVVAYPGWHPLSSRGSGQTELILFFSIFAPHILESRRPRLALSVSDHNGWFFLNVSLDYPRSLRSKGLSACGRQGLCFLCNISNARVLVRMPRGVVRVSALGLYLGVIPFKGLKASPEVHCLMF